MTVENLQERIQTEPDFVNLKRFDFSLHKTMERYPDGAPIKVIAQALLMTEPEVEEMLERVVFKLKSYMKVGSDD